MTTTATRQAPTAAAKLTDDELEHLERILSSFHSALDGHLYAIFTEQYTSELFEDIDTAEKILARLRAARTADG